MPNYRFRCPEHGDFDIFIPMTALTATRKCGTCERDSQRVLLCPSLNLGDQTARRLLDATKETSDHPPVVTSLPPSARPRRNRVTHNPLTKKLPRH